MLGCFGLPHNLATTIIIGKVDDDEDRRLGGGSFVVSHRSFSFELLSSAAKRLGQSASKPKQKQYTIEGGQHHEGRRW